MLYDISEHIQSVVFVLYTGITLILLGLAYFQITGKSRLSLLMIALGSLSISLFVCLSDPFLHMWDEQIHAVVAKNMVHNPLKPMLMTAPILPYDFTNWTVNHIWVHKQPLFLWQIALSFKLFGINTLSLRLPSILMTTLLIIPVYRIGKIISGKQTGIYAAILLSGSNFIYQLNSGRMNTDHNDIAFLFYVTLSIWSWFEKENSSKKIWIILIGLFSGAAILNKWLVGLLVYAGWGLSILIFKDNRNKIKSYIEILESIAITIIVALPWQLYILNKFPVESKYEFNYNSLHFFKAIENHGGGLMYHIDKIQTLYGIDFQYIIYASLIVFLFSRIKTKYITVIFIWILIVNVFYAIAATKMPAFTIIIAPLIYIVVAQALFELFTFINNVLDKQKINKFVVIPLSIVLVFYLFFHFLDYNGLTLKNREWHKNSAQMSYNSTQVYKNLSREFKGKDYMFFNAREFDHLKILFYTDFRAKPGVPSQIQIDTLKNHKIKIMVFDNDKLPDYILNDSTIAKIKSQVWQKDYKGKIEVYYK